MFSKKNNVIIQDHAYTTPDSPKVVRERKSTIFDAPAVPSPRITKRKINGEINMQKMIYDLNASCWTLKYSVIDEDFAKGAYGKIILAKDKLTEEKVVIKKIPQTTPIRMINNEVKAGKMIGTHDNIASLLQYVEKPDFHFLVFQFINGQDLFNYLEKLSFAPRTDKEARNLITQILKGLRHIHSKDIAHRDIKLENILISPTGEITVVDLGLCAFIEDGKLCKDWCGSDNYLAPEIVRRTPYCGYKADVFSTGVVLFALLFGVFPFENLRVNGPSSLDKNKTLKKLQVRFPADVKVSHSAKDLLSKMLEDDPESRISMKDIFRHEWLLGSTISEEEEIRSTMKRSCESTQTPATMILS